MQYARKMGSSALVIAAAFAVAFAVLVSSPQTAEAEIQIRSVSNDGTVSFSPTGAGDANNGDTRYSQHASADGFVQFEISTTGAASASFTHSEATDDGQKIICNAGATGARNDCDADLTDGGVTVALKIDDDSGKGIVFVKQTRLTGSGGNAEITEAISVTVAQVPTKITVRPVSKSIDAEDGSTFVTIRLLDENNRGIGGKRLTVVSTRALLSGEGGTTAAAGTGITAPVGGLADVVLGEFSSTTTGVLAGQVSTSTDLTATADDDEAGYARVLVSGGGSPGISTVTVTYGEVTGSADIVLHGAVKTIEAVAEQSAIEVGGGTYIVVTALDSAGNPVKGQHADVKQVGGVTPPSKGDNQVEQNNDNAKNTRDLTKFETGDIPACGDVAAVEDDASTTDVDESRPLSDGTNDDGKCVIQIEAGGEDTPTNPADDAARGTHTIVVVASEDGTDGPKGVNEVTLEIQVGGAPATITSDAPARIDASGEVTINVTVLDDADVRVGGVVIEAFQTAGSGKIIGDIAAKTSDGRAKFTYLAPSTPGVVEFLVRTRTAPADEPGSKVTAQLPIIINIGAEEEEAPPEAPSLSRAPSSTGFTLVTFSGGSVDDLSDALTAACGDGVRAWATDYQGNYVSFFPSAPAVVNSGFNALFSDGVPANEPLLVGNCGG